MNYSSLFLILYLATCNSFTTRLISYTFHRTKGGERCNNHQESNRHPPTTPNPYAPLLSTPQISEPETQTYQKRKEYTLSTKYYTYNGWKLSYQHKEPTSRSNSMNIFQKKSPKKPPLLLIHPVGIGLSSWFWDRLIECWDGEVFAPDLIGCSRDENCDVWDPNQRGMSFPLDWVKACEALVKDEMREKCAVITQGGLAPVGIMLAHRDSDQQKLQASSRVSSLILTSPPIWNDMITPIPTKELDFNYNFLKSPILGSLAFFLLETRPAIQFFSDLFLFQDKCDDEWLKKTLAVESSKRKALRPPVMAFNAGLLNHRSFKYEMKELTQSTMILVGDADKRTKDRMEYTTEMKDCQITSIEGCNVLPWENTQKTCDAIEDFCKDKGIF